MTTQENVEKKEDDKKYKVRKEVQPTYKNIYMHLMEETPKNRRNNTKQNIIKETNKQQQKGHKTIKNRKR